MSRHRRQQKRRAGRARIADRWSDWIVRAALAPDSERREIGKRMEETMRPLSAESLNSPLVKMLPQELSTEWSVLPWSEPVEPHDPNQYEFRQPPPLEWEGKPIPPALATTDALFAGFGFRRVE